LFALVGLCGGVASRELPHDDPFRLPGRLFITGIVTCDWRSIVGPVGSINAGHVNTIGGVVFTTAGADTTVRRFGVTEPCEVAGARKVGSGTFETAGTCITLVGEVAHRATFGRGRGVADCTRGCTRGDAMPESGGLEGGAGDA